MTTWFAPGSMSQEGPSAATQPVAGRPPHPAAIRTVGEVTHQRGHTWKGVIEVNADNVIYENGMVATTTSSIPEGVTFTGNRRGVTLRNLTFNGVGNGIVLNNQQRADDVVIDNCKFLDCRTPDDQSQDGLLGSRGYGAFVSAGRNWTIRNSVFTTKAKDGGAPDDRACSVQYAARLGEVHGLRVSDSRFENWMGKPCVWLMFVKDALFDRVEFSGGRIWIGAPPGAMAEVEKGDCRNIVFRGCKFNFGVFDDWPASINIMPGSESIYFADCEVNTVPDCEWWIEIDSRDTRTIRWTNCKWNGKVVEGFNGVRTQLSQEEMQRRNIGPIESDPDSAFPASAPADSS